MNSIIERIGEPAALEQLAEECTELAQVALKRARILRGENPTPKKLEETDDNFLEEIADVLTTLEVLGYEYSPNNLGEIDMRKAAKKRRWQERLRG